MKNETAQLLRRLPSISKFLASEAGKALSAEFGEGVTKLELRRLINTLRTEIQHSLRKEVPDESELHRLLKQGLVRLTRAEGIRAVNASGVLLHTGLGRAPLCSSALEIMSSAQGYSVLQVDLASGGRSLREHKIEQMYCMADLIPNGALTPFAQAMPDQYKCIDAVRAYRNYYRCEKAYFAKWQKGRAAPQWWVDSMSKNTEASV